jgi:PAS domain S-box-containing protein
MTAMNGRHDQKSLYRQLMDGLYDAILVTDPNGHLIELNARATEYFQHKPEDVWDQPVSMLVPGVTANLVAHVRKELAESRHIMLDARCQRQDGTAFSAEVTISVIDLMNSGDLVFTVRNTERRRKQWEMLRSKANAFANAQSGCFVCDGGRQFRAVNRAFLDMFDLADEGAVLGRPFEELMPDDPLPSFFDRALEGESLSYRVVADTDTGVPEEVEVQMAPDRQGKEKVVGVVGSLLHL